MKNWLYILSVALAVAFTTPGVAAAADLGQRQYVSSEAPVVAKDWTGIYAGFLIGWSTTDFNADTRKVYDIDDAPSKSLEFGDGNPVGLSGNGDGFNAGVQFGVDQRFGGIVIGAIADWSFIDNDASDTQQFDIFGNTESDFDDFNLRGDFGVDWLATARLRLGVPVNEFLMPYVHGGIAWANVQGSFSFRDLDGDIVEPFPGGVHVTQSSFEEMRVGWTVGAGLEAKITDNIRAKVEYLYVDLGEVDTFVNRDASGNDRIGELELQMHVIRAGLAYQF